jgi:hypothetical protein
MRGILLQEDVILEKVKRIEFMEEERQSNLKHSSTVELNLQKLEDELLKTQELRDAAEQRIRDTQRVCGTLVQRVEELTAKIQVLEHERESLCSKDDVITAQQALLTAQNELAELENLLQSAELGGRAVLIDLVSVMREAMLCGKVSGPAHLVRLVRMINEGALPPLEEIFEMFNFAVSGEVCVFFHLSVCMKQTETEQTEEARLETKFRIRVCARTAHAPTSRPTPPPHTHRRIRAFLHRRLMKRINSRTAIQT